jgi:hypothetical protein
MGRVIKFSVVDGAGVGASGQLVVAGGFELTTGSGGLAQALLDDGPTTIKVNGVVAYEGPTAELKPLEVITTAGVRRT